jgi:hypothetical protein
VVNWFTSSYEAELRYVCVSAYCKVMSKVLLWECRPALFVGHCVLNPFISFDPSFLQRN